ncbi:MAG: hypothetical protein K8T26_18205 [Lentisphaerae bacterium]|nr:hypothetical protein [Lentisphaerota bacterium]
MSHAYLPTLASRAMGNLLHPALGDGFLPRGIPDAGNGFDPIIALVTVPDSGQTLLLLGASLAILGFLHWKFTP